MTSAIVIVISYNHDSNAEKITITSNAAIVAKYASPKYNYYGKYICQRKHQNSYLDDKKMTKK